MGRYANMIDFLFCELISGVKSLCNKYYTGEGESLSQLRHVSRAQIELWDVYMAASLHVAGEALRQQVRLSWAEFRSATLKAMEAGDTDDT